MCRSSCKQEINKCQSIELVNGYCTAGKKSQFLIQCFLQTPDMESTRSTDHVLSLLLGQSIATAPDLLIHWNQNHHHLPDRCDCGFCLLNWASITQLLQWVWSPVTNFTRTADSGHRVNQWFRRWCVHRRGTTPITHHSEQCQFKAVNPKLHRKGFNNLTDRQHVKLWSNSAKAIPLPPTGKPPRKTWKQQMASSWTRESSRRSSEVQFTGFLTPKSRIFMRTAT